MISNQLLRQRKSWRPSSHLDLPGWMQDNEYILDSHRPELKCVMTCLASVFRIHSETGNIWTHLLGFIAVCWFASQDLLGSELHYREKIAFGISYVSAAICLIFSTLFHTLSCHSRTIAKNFNKLDYAGIGIMISGSFTTWLYYGFYCHHFVQTIYIIIVSSFGIATLLLSLWEKFSTPQFRVVRATFFVTFGLFGLMPAAHWLWLYGWQLAMMKGLGWLTLMAICYIVGAALYASRMPERWLPGKCDVWFQSHQLLHIFTLIGIGVHFYGCKKLANYVLANEIATNCDTAAATAPII